MTRREQAINEVMEKIDECRDAQSAVAKFVLMCVLSDLIDQAESGKLKEPIVRSFAGINGMLTVYPDGREERS